MNISTTHGTGSHPGHDHETTAAISRSIGAWGAVQLGTMVLITPEEIDQAEKRRWTTALRTVAATKFAILSETPAGSQASLM